MVLTNHLPAGDETGNTMTSKQAIGSLILVLFSILSNRIHAQSGESFGLTFPLDIEGKERFTARLVDNGHKPQCPSHSFRETTYITPKMRFELCEKTAERFGIITHEYINSSHLECYDDKHNHPGEPCAMFCPRAPRDCKNASPLAKLILTSHVRCGPRHYCDDGCCIEDPQQAVAETTTPPPTTPPSTTPPSTTPSPTTPLSTTPTTEPAPLPNDNETIVLAREFLEYGKSLLKDLHEIALYKFSKELFTCPKEGKFAPRHRADHSRRYFDCRYVATVHQCPKEKLFDETKKECVKKTTHIEPEPEVSVKEWSHFIKCHKEGIFTSPYDCRFFYYCSPKHELSLGKSRFHISIQKCRHHLVFNGNSCEYPDKVVCNNQPLPTHHDTDWADEWLE